MRIAICWNSPQRLVDLTVRHELYVQGFHELGHEVVVLARRSSAEGFPYPVQVFDSSTDLRALEFWKRVGADVVLIVTWHGMAEVLRAARAAGSRTVAISDSDGVMSARYFPWIVLRRMLAIQTGPQMKVPTAKFWLQRVLINGKRDDSEVVESTRHSDAVLMCSSTAKAHFKALLDFRGAGDFGGRVHVVPYPVNEDLFCGPSIPIDRDERVVAIGRWDDPQKNAGLLARAIRQHLSRGHRTEITVLGRGGERWFEPLSRRFPSVRYMGVQPPSVVAELLRQSRILLISSRWESGPIVANEALCCGCTIVSTPLTNMIALCAGGLFGQVAVQNGRGALARALSAELDAWRRRERRPDAIANHWRPRLRPARICGDILRSVGLAELPGPSSESAMAALPST